MGNKSSSYPVSKDGISITRPEEKYREWDDAVIVNSKEKYSYLNLKTHYHDYKVSLKKNFPLYKYFFLLLLREK